MNDCTCKECGKSGRLYYTGGGKCMCDECYKINKQKFHRGYLVKLNDVFPEWMSHFDNAGGLALVIQSYRDAYGGGPENNPAPNYTLLHENGKSSSWYVEPLLTLICKNGGELIKEKAEEFKQCCAEYDKLSNRHSVESQAILDYIIEEESEL